MKVNGRAVDTSTLVVTAGSDNTLLVNGDAAAPQWRLLVDDNVPASVSTNAKLRLVHLLSGLGSFQYVYRTKEDPAQASHSFANHAHDDYAEIALELGLPGILLVLLFVLWWARRSYSAWTGSFSGAALARASSVMIGIVLFHSLVDYPIRTTAIAALFAAACAWLLPAPIAQKRRGVQSSTGEGGARHLQAD